MPMTIRLKDIHGNKMLARYPDDPQWWITGFNPEYLHVPADETIAFFTWDMSADPGMFDAFFRSAFDWETEMCKDPLLVLNPFTQVAAFTQVPDGMVGACVV
jgi:hypothetical protein